MTKNEVTVPLLRMAYRALWYSRKRRRWVYGPAARYDLERLANGGTLDVSEVLRTRATVAIRVANGEKPAKIARTVGWRLGRVYRLQADMKAARDALPLVVGYTRGRRRKYSREQLSEVERLLRQRRASYSPAALDEALELTLASPDYGEWGRIAPTIAQISSSTRVDVSTIKKIRAALRLRLPQRKYRRRFKAALRQLKPYVDPNARRPRDRFA